MVELRVKIELDGAIFDECVISLNNGPPPPQMGHEDCVRLVLRAGAKVDQPRADGATPLFKACHKVIYSWYSLTVIVTAFTSNTTTYFYSCYFFYSYFYCFYLFSSY